MFPKDILSDYFFEELKVIIAGLFEPACYLLDSAVELVEPEKSGVLLKLYDTTVFLQHLR